MPATPIADCHLQDITTSLGPERNNIILASYAWADIVTSHLHDIVVVVVSFTQTRLQRVGHATFRALRIPKTQ